MDDPTAVPSERRIDVTPDGPDEVHGSLSLEGRSGSVTDRGKIERPQIASALTVIDCADPEGNDFCLFRDG